MADNMSAYWIGEYRKQLDDLKIPYSPEATKEELKNLLVEAKGKAPKSHARVTKEVTAVVDKRVEDLEARLIQMQAQFAAFMASPHAPAAPSNSAITGDDLLKAVLKAADGRQTEYGLLREEYIPPGDELPVTKVYYMAGPTHNIWGKEVAGHWTPPPLGRKCIKFVQAIGWTSREGSGLRQKRIATCECKSKTIANWIEGLAEFGRSIYLNMGEAMTATPAGEFMEIYKKHFDSLSSMPFGKITELASQTYGIPTNIGKTHRDYAADIAETRAWAELEQRKNQFEQVLRTKGVQQMVRDAAAPVTR